MSNQPSSSSASHRWRPLEAFNRHPLVNSVLLVTTLLAALAGFLSDSGLGDWLGRGSDHGAASGSTPTDSLQPAPDAPDSDSELSASIAVGSCLDDEGALTACDAAHAAEVFNVSGNCTPGSLLGYLGGSPGQDVLRADLSIRSWQIEDVSACIVDAPSDTQTFDGQDSLLRRSGDVWRRCRDELAREVSCSDAHRSEVVYERQGPGESLDCETRADEYLGISFDNHAGDLELLQDSAHCYIEVRGEGMLTHSLRRLGSNALPLTTRDRN